MDFTNVSPEKRKQMTEKTKRTRAGMKATRESMSEAEWFGWCSYAAELDEIAARAWLAKRKIEAHSEIVEKLERKCAKQGIQCTDEMRKEAIAKCYFDYEYDPKIKGVGHRYG